MLSTLELEYIQHLERGYCANHPDVIAQTKDQVVDRAVKQLLTALQSNGFELDGNILKRGDGWLQYDADDSAWQYSNDAGVTWQEIGAGGGGVTDHTLLTNIGATTHADLDSHVGDTGMHAIIGEITILSHATLPAGWLLCNAQTILRSSALGQLYAALGFPYGVGDGTTTCNVPDLRAKFPYGFGLTNTALGDAGGAETAQLTEYDLPAHVHSTEIPYSSAAGTSNTVVRGGAQEGAITLTSNASSGQGKAFNVLPPYLVLHFIVYAG